MYGWSRLSVTVGSGGYNPRFGTDFTNNGRKANNVPTVLDSDQVHHGPVTHGGAAALRITHGLVQFGILWPKGQKYSR